MSSSQSNNYYQTAYAQAPRYNYSSVSNVSKVDGVKNSSSHNHQYTSRLIDATSNSNTFQSSSLNNMRHCSSLNVNNPGPSYHQQSSKPKPQGGSGGGYQITIAIKNSSPSSSSSDSSHCNRRPEQVVEATVPPLPVSRPALPPVNQTPALPPPPPQPKAVTASPSKTATVTSAKPSVKPSASKELKPVESKPTKTDGVKEISKDEFNLRLLKEILETVGEESDESSSSDDEELTVADLLELLECLRAKKSKKKKHSRRSSNKNKIFERLLV
jgi:hypothetical protein